MNCIASPKSLPAAGRLSKGKDFNNKLSILSGLQAPLPWREVGVRQKANDQNNELHSY